MAADGYVISFWGDDVVKPIDHKLEKHKFYAIQKISQFLKKYPSYLSFYQSFVTCSTCKFSKLTTGPAHSVSFPSEESTKTTYNCSFCRRHETYS